MPTSYPRPLRTKPPDDYGRLTALLSRGRMHALKGECRISRADMLAAAEGWVLAAIPPAEADAVWVAGCERPPHA